MKNILKKGEKKIVKFSCMCGEEWETDEWKSIESNSYLLDLTAYIDSCGCCGRMVSLRQT